MTVSISPDNTMIASGSGDQSIKLWRISDGILISNFTGHYG
jgi:WD40 repeat protein